MSSRSPEAKERRRERERAKAHAKADQVREQITKMPPVECACGCGTRIPALTMDGKPRRYADRHGGRAPRADGGVGAPWEAFTIPQFDVEPPCVGEDPDLFWSYDEAETSLAKAVCHRCPVREQCLAWALKHCEHDGVWGGLTSLERVRLRRQNPGPDLSAVARSAVEEAMTRGLTHAQKQAAITWLTRRGESAEDIASRLGMSSRTVHRWRRRLREAA